MKAAFDKISSFIRWRDWGPGKIPVFCTLLAYIALANQDFSTAFLIRFIIFIFFAISQSALGYVVNDWGDRQIDRIHGKNNAFDNLSVFKGRLCLGALASLAIVSGLPFMHRPVFLPLWMGWIFFTCAYSLKPLRLKERGAWGLGISSLAQWTLPVFIAFSAMGRFGRLDMLIFAIASTISGATLEIAHQRYDRARDTSTQTNTFGARTSAKKLDRIYSFALIFDKLAIGAVVMTIVKGMHSVPGKNSLFIFALSFLYPAIYLCLLVVAAFEVITATSNGHLLDPYYSTGHSSNKLLHETLPNLIIPGSLLLAMTIANPFTAILLFTFLYWRIILGKADWRWPFLSIKKYLLR